MTHIYANQHGSLLLNSLRELQIVQITAGLGVDLPQDIRCLRQVKLHPVTHSDDL